MPAWLPELCETDGVWDEVLCALYAVFRRDFPDDPPMLDGCPVWWDRRVLDRFEEAFWHLITRENQKTGERLFDPRRAERLAWCRAIIRNCADPAVKRWRYRAGSGQIRVYLWLEAHNYVVVLEPRRAVYVLVSAHHIDGDSRRRNLQRKYDRREP